MPTALSRREFARSLACALAGACLPGSLRGRTPPEVRESIRVAAGFLVHAQSSDGSWRSEVRGVFRDGEALTPLVLRALQGLPEALRPREAIRRARLWMRDLASRLQANPEPWSGLRYPVFTASHAARLGPSDLWSGILRRLQLSAELGWQDTDARSGGWSDAVGPVPFTGAEELADLNNPNLSATAAALDGLEGAAHRSVRRSALAFVERCQNFRLNAPADGDLDDGGFFFALDDSIRNKAGVAQVDATGRRRFRSYGSATCDGLLSLVAAGLPPDQPRIQAAIHWLRRHAGETPHPGNWPPARRAGAAGLAFYFAQAYARSLRWINRSLPSFQDWSRDQLAALNASLLARQAGDGSWANPEPESFEDDPLLATAFALRALTADNSD